MSDLKSEKISPTRPPMAYPKMQKKKKLGGVIFGIVGGFLLRQSEILHLHGFK
jgi:hypothetical protein